MKKKRREQVSTLFSDSEGTPFKASDIKAIAGVTYRQLNQWDSKGVISSARDTKDGWRRFTFRELFAVLICAELRAKFGATLEQLRWITSCMIRQEANHFAWAVEAMSFGLTIYLLTDLKDTFIMDSDRAFGQYFERGDFRGDDPRGLILLKLNPLVNRILSSLKKPLKLKTSDWVYAAERDFKSSVTARNEREREVLRQIRRGEFQKVTIVTRRGETIRIDRKEELSEGTRAAIAAEIEELIQRRNYTKLEVTIRDGQVVRITGKKTVKRRK